jgi:hypothetical protein
MKRVSIPVILALLVTGLLPSVGQAAPATVRHLQAHGIGPATPPLRCKGAAATQVHAFTVQAEWTKQVLKNTEKAIVKVTVTRPPPYDPFGLGIPLPPVYAIPVEGANVWTSVITGRWPFPYGYGQTDANGQVTFKIDLRLLKKAGPYDVSHYAAVWTNQGGCPDIEEWGYLRQSPGLTIRP